MNTLNLNIQYKIFVDKVDLSSNHNQNNGRLLEYLNAKNIHYDYVPDTNDKACLIDQICFNMESNKKTLLILNLNTIKKLCTEKSPYNNFFDMISNGAVRLIYYQWGDDLWDVAKLFYSTREQDIQVCETLSNLKFTWWSACKVGSNFVGKFKNAKIVKFPGTTFSFFRGHFSTLMDNSPKSHTFFTLTKLNHGSVRRHRNVLANRIKDQAFLKDAISRISLIDHENYHAKQSLFDDLNEDYGKTFIDNWPFLDMLPAISYYKKTYFEVVTETLGADDGDDSFFVTDKTLKPITMGHPFLLLSTKHMLKNLRELGFQTFGEYLDESYDECDTAEERVEIISKNLEKLDLEASKKLYDSTKEIRQHNQIHLMHLIGTYKYDLWNCFNDAFEKIDS